MGHLTLTLTLTLAQALTLTLTLTLTRYEDTWVTVYWPELKATCGQGAPDDITTIYVREPFWARARATTRAKMTG